MYQIWIVLDWDGLYGIKTGLFGLDFTEQRTRTNNQNAISDGGNTQMKGHCGSSTGSP